MRPNLQKIFGPSGTFKSYTMKYDDIPRGIEEEERKKSLRQLFIEAGAADGLYEDILKDMEKKREEGLQNIRYAIEKDYIRALYAPPPLVLNHTFDVDSIWPDTHWNQLRATVLQGEWIIKKEKKLNKKEMREKITYLEDRLKTIDEEVYGRAETLTVDKIVGLHSRVRNLENEKRHEAIDCHTCGCVVRKEIAFRGHNRIERVTYYQSRYGLKDPTLRTKEVTHETWYCKLHKRGKKEYGSK